MQKLVITGVITFALGVLAGRLTMTTPAPPPPPAIPSFGAAPLAGSIKGRVAEVLQVPQYTYLRLESGEWAAVSSVPDVKVGQEVTVLVQTQMSNFTSPSLNRKFDRIFFGAVEGAR